MRYINRLAQAYKKLSCRYSKPPYASNSHHLCEIFCHRILPLPWHPA